MSVRKRKWIWKGQEREAWIVVYTDQGGQRQHKTFETQKAAKDWAASTRIEVKDAGLTLRTRPV